MEKDWSKIKYFRPSEFDSPDVPGSHTNMNMWFVFLLDFIRHGTKKPMILTSAYRTMAKNREVGGVSGSSHMKGLAVDIEVIDNEYRLSLIGLALKMKINRIGIGQNFIHLDIDNTKPECIWVYA